MLEWRLWLLWSISFPWFQYQGDCNAFKETPTKIRRWEELQLTQNDNVLVWLWRSLKSVSLPSKYRTTSVGVLKASWPPTADKLTGTQGFRKTGKKYDFSVCLNWLRSYLGHVEKVQTESFCQIWSWSQWLQRQVSSHGYVQQHLTQALGFILA